MTATPEVLFVCVHNQGRSQMAAALLDHHAQGRVHVRSAGSEPADFVNPAVVDVMAELGIDVSEKLPTKLTTEDVAASDVVITMGCGDACPIFPASATRTGPSPTPPAGAPTRSAPSATRSTSTSSGSWPRSPHRPARRQKNARRGRSAVRTRPGHHLSAVRG